MKHRVTASYESAYSEALAVGKGERLRFERRPTEWPGWIWCTTEGGRSAWVPESWVTIDGDVCTMSRDYDSRELTVRPDDPVEVLFEESGWARVRNAEGAEGWIPADRISPGGRE